MLNTYEFALLLERWLYLTEIPVSCFARRVTFRAIPVWFRGFASLITRRDGCARILRFVGRNATSRDVPRRKRSPYNRNICLIGRSTLSVLCWPTTLRTHMRDSFQARSRAIVKILSLAFNLAALWFSHYTHWSHLHHIPTERI